MSDGDSLPLHSFFEEVLQYLKILGNNIQKRSQNVIDKKVKKEYLQSPANVQKTAEKIYLICSLSKMSLDKVQDNVKKTIDNYLEKSLRPQPSGETAGTNVKTTDSEKHINMSSKVKREYNTIKPDINTINFNAKTVIIPKRVDFKHYSQCKVEITHFPLYYFNKYEVAETDSICKEEQSFQKGYKSSANMTFPKHSSRDSRKHSSKDRHRHRHQHHHSKKHQHYTSSRTVVESSATLHSEPTAEGILILDLESPAKSESPLKSNEQESSINVNFNTDKDSEPSLRELNHVHIAKAGNLTIEKPQTEEMETVKEFDNTINELEASSKVVENLPMTIKKRTLKISKSISEEEEENPKNGSNALRKVKRSSKNAEKSSECLTETCEIIQSSSDKIDEIPKKGHNSLKTVREILEEVEEAPIKEKEALNIVTDFEGTEKPSTQELPKIIGSEENSVEENEESKDAKEASKKEDEQMNEVSKQVDEVPKQVDEDTEQVDKFSKRVSEDPKHVDDTPKTMDIAPEKVNETPKQVDEDPKSVDKSPKQFLKCINISKLMSSYVPPENSTQSAIKKVGELSNQSAIINVTPSLKRTKVVTFSDQSTEIISSPNLISNHDSYSFYKPVIEPKKKDCKRPSRDSKRNSKIYIFDSSTDTDSGSDSYSSSSESTTTKNLHARIKTSIISGTGFQPSVSIARLLNSNISEFEKLSTTEGFKRVYDECGKLFFNNTKSNTTDEIRKLDNKTAKILIMNSSSSDEDSQSSGKTERKNISSSDSENSQSRTCTGKVKFFSKDPSKVNSKVNTKVSKSDNEIRNLTRLPRNLNKIGLCLSEESGSEESQTNPKTKQGINAEDPDNSVGGKNDDEMGRSQRIKSREPVAVTVDTERTQSDSSTVAENDSSQNKSGALLELVTNGVTECNNEETLDDDSDSPQSSGPPPKSVSFAEKPMETIKNDLLDDDDDGDETSDLEPGKVNGKNKKPRKSPNPKNVNRNNETMDESENEEDDMNEDSNNSTASKSSKNALNISNSDQNGNDSDAKENEDYEDKLLSGSESEDSEIFVPAMRKRKQNKGSSGESQEGSDSETKSPKKRRRIKRLSGEDSEGGDDDDASGSDGEGKKGGRKNIRKVKRSTKLDSATRIAARKEKERVQRISERQKLYNESLFDESGRPDEVVKLDKVVLDFDPETKEPLISVDTGIVGKLKPHQANGIKFMWDACFESVKQINETKGSGCILAHCMGLGKTLQVVALVHTLLLHQEKTKVQRVLVVCPLSTVLNWVNEFRMWLEHAESDDEVNIFELSKFKQNGERSHQLREWVDCGGVCVLGYEMFRNLSADNNKKFRKAQLSAFQKALVDPGPDLVVCDEGHLLKNEKTSLSQSMNKVKTLRRIVLTGTPLQNNLKEYYCMVQFVKPNLLGKYNEYLNRFVNPITNGQYTDSTEHDIKVMKRRSHVLHNMLEGAVQRRDYAVLAPFLPPKHEYVLFISLTEIQIKLYRYYLDNFSRRPHPDKKNTGFLFPDFQALQRIWTHPLVMKANSERYEIMQQKKRDKEEEDSEGSLADFIDDDEDTTTPDETSESNNASDDSDETTTKKKKKKKSKNSKVPHKRVTRANATVTAVDNSDDEMMEPKVEETPRLENPTEWWVSLCSEEELDDVRHSNKLLLLLDILKMCEAIGDKLLVFSQSLYSLDLIEQFLSKIDDATQKSEEDDHLAGHLGSWSSGLDYFRLDGSTSCENRSIWCNSFNKEDNPRARLFLISTRAGGLGINLVAANRVVIFDMSWNPSHDVQSIFRVYRFGQKKPCYVYRFLALGTMEEKIYERQVTKQAISKRVIDEQQIDRHYAESDLGELYQFCPVPEGSREVPKLPRDRLFADLLSQHDTVIYKYHEHDSLLENKEEETLTEEERKAAWDDYENEKTRPPPTIGNNMLFGLQQQQQQQMAMMALNSVLRQDYPGLSDQQLSSMMPTILQQMYQNGDPALSPQMYPGYDFSLMQKINAMMAAQSMMGGGFKYPQANNMQPGMVLNPANLAAGAMGNARVPMYQQSWQQQQQIQLQRLQQQQAMQANMKYYAGGLGSRDTSDMQALQLRQRAMLLGNSSSTIPQRGRPRATPLPTEVVDLDSE